MQYAPTNPTLHFVKFQFIFLAQKIRHIYIFFSYEKYINIAHIFIFLLFIKFACVCVCYSPNGYMVYHLWFSFCFSNFFAVWVAEDSDPYIDILHIIILHVNISVIFLKNKIRAKLIALIFIFFIQIFLFSLLVVVRS